MKIKKYILFVNENLSSQIKISDEFSDLKKDLIEMVEKTVEDISEESLKEKLIDFIQDPEKNPIEGLINDSDIYEFYLKWRNDIDGILSDTKFYKKSPGKNDIYSLYDYVVVGTKRALKRVASLILKDMEDDSNTESEPSE